MSGTQPTASPTSTTYIVPEYSESIYVKLSHQIPHLKSTSSSIVATSSQFDLSADNRMAYLTSTAIFPIILFAIILFFIFCYQIYLLLRSRCKCCFCFSCCRPNDVRILKSSSNNNNNSDDGEYNQFPNHHKHLNTSQSTSLSATEPQSVSLEVKIKRSRYIQSFQLLYLSIICLLTSSFSVYFGVPLLTGSMNHMGISLNSASSSFYLIQHSAKDISLLSSDMNLTLYSSYCSDFNTSTKKSLLTQNRIISTASTSVTDTVGSIPNNLKSMSNILLGSNGGVENKAYYFYIYTAVIIVFIYAIFHSSMSKSNCLLSSTVLATEILMIALALGATVFMITTVLLGDFCVDPTMNTITTLNSTMSSSSSSSSSSNNSNNVFDMRRMLLNNTNTTNTTTTTSNTTNTNSNNYQIHSYSVVDIVTFYTTCNGSNPFDEAVSVTDTACESIKAILNNHSNIAGLDNCVDAITRQISFMQQDTDYISDESSCSTINTYYASIVYDNLCTDTIQGIFIVFITIFLVVFSFFLSLLAISNLFLYFAQEHKRMQGYYNNVNNRNNRDNNDNRVGDAYGRHGHKKGNKKSSVVFPEIIDITESQTQDAVAQPLSESLVAAKQTKFRH